MRGGALLATFGLGAALLIAEPAAGVAGFALLGAGVAVVVPSVFRAAGNAAASRRAPRWRRSRRSATAASSSGPPIIGAIASATSLPAALTLVLVATAIVAALAPRVGD